MCNCDEVVPWPGLGAAGWAVAGEGPAASAAAAAVPAAIDVVRKSRRDVSGSMGVSIIVVLVEVLRAGEHPHAVLENGEAGGQPRTPARPWIDPRAVHGFVFLRRL